MKYDNKYTCICCGDLNEIVITDHIDTIITECKTKCIKCGFEGYWVTGFFEKDKCDFDLILKIRKEQNIVNKLY
jgi:hypothetical protein